MASTALTYFLIDDDLDDQEIFISAMENISPESQCITAVNGQDALNKLKSKCVEPDIIFLDLNMPLMDGVQFLKEFMKDPEFTHIPVIILTTSSDQMSKRHTLELGAKDFLTKPDTFSQWEIMLKKQSTLLDIDS